MDGPALITAAAFIREQQFEAPAHTSPVSFGPEAGPDFDEGPAQGVVVDSNVVAFPQHTPVEVRDAVSDWMLFAQLVATHKYPGGSDTEGWSDAYLEVLRNTGWTLGEEVGSWTEERVTGSIVHQQILSLVAVALGPVPTALAIVTAALNGLQRMNERSRWITLFDRRGKSAKSVGFSVAAVEPSEHTVELHSVDFRVDARTEMTQVLFFKFTDSSASIFRRSTVLSLAADAMQHLGPQIKTRVRDLASANIAAYDLAEV
jgi:hypothetical protein